MVACLALIGCYLLLVKGVLLILVLRFGVC